MSYPPCPPFKYVDDHLNQDAHLTYLGDTMAWFTFWADTGLGEYNRLLQGQDMAGRKQVDDEADTILKDDPLISSVPIVPPSTREQFKACFDHCGDIGTREIRTAVDAALRTKCSSLYVQWLTYEIVATYDNMRIVALVMNACRQKNLSFLRRYVDPASPAPFIPRQVNHVIERPEQGRKRLNRVGHKFLYWDEISQDVIECEIIGLGEEPGEEWFAINKTAGGKTMDDVVTAEQLDILLLHEL